MKLHKTFDSLPDFLDYLEGTDTAWPGLPLASEERPSKWNGDITYLQALNLARFGWAEGRNRLHDVAYDISPEDIEVEATEEITLDVASAYPVPALAVTGDPCCMIDVQAAETESKIIRVVVSLGHSCSMSADSLFSLGAASLSYIDALENAGWRVELWAHWESRSNRKTCSTDICLKRAQDHADMDILAFAVVHPSMLRRLLFRYLETFQETRSFNSNYGTPVNENPGDCQVYIPGNPPQFRKDTDAALSYVKEHMDGFKERAA